LASQRPPGISGQFGQRRIFLVGCHKAPAQSATKGERETLSVSVLQISDCAKLPALGDAEFFNHSILTVEVLIIAMPRELAQF
jgi:hypothetical protein